MRVAEVEFAFAFERALSPRPAPYSRDEVFNAVSALRLSIEVPDSRYVDFTAVGAPQLIADTACASWLMLSPPISTEWRSVDLSAHAVRAIVNGTVVAEGTGKAALGDPRDALVWIVNEVCRFADGIKAGDIVTTGTCIVPAAVAPGDTVTADYGPFGTLTARID
jgi:2-keto-4-pentenoate hydratase